MIMIVDKYIYEKVSSNAGARRDVVIIAIIKLLLGNIVEMGF